jgi:hypothetical protein
VEKRIVALEHRQPSVPVPAPVPEPVAPVEPAAAQNVTAQGGARTSTSRFRSAPVSLAIGSGEALVFLPRDQAADLPNESRFVAALGRIGRLFQRTTPRPGNTKSFKG